MPAEKVKLWKRQLEEKRMAESAHPPVTGGGGEEEGQHLLSG